jgi:hypothetical protein
MIEFDVQCQICKKPITLRVRDEQCRAFFEENGALCEVCHERGDRPARAPRAA